MRLSAVDEDDEASETIEQEVFLGDLPWMTERGTFIINGSERVIVSQSAPLTRCILRTKCSPERYTAI
ncbi:MAG: hypothetical protein U5K69_03975 [Balneolaceae bacterium]|nr:hypothetical protein [Balneolaceae bacterium]